MNAKFRPAIALLGVTILVSAVGCFGPAGPKVGQVEGTVLDNGKPVSNAKVTFFPADGRPSYGSTDSNGHYVLKYSDSIPGAVVGSHDVQINIMSMSVPQRQEGMAPNKVSRTAMPAIPKRYSWPTTVEVTDGMNDLSFDLKEAKSR
ncbi:carboxypeptidase-like regulatory domain-containing protein [Bremerella sp. JC817]|uniref:carboxypeptidase-like regulatory domain-containing protein n=1 Tax=Bremerella sp. JC817 TaxID=3231756 RepID=UPI0034583EBD